MGAGADVNAIFGIASMIIAVPTGVKVFNWLFTMYGGRVVFSTPMLWSIGFMVTFVLGGMTGVLLAVPPADFVLHNSLFLVAHFHNVIIGGVLFGAFAGYTYWFPKAFGFRLHEGLGKAAFWCWFIGFYVAFMPLYVLGLMGMTRRMQHYDVPAWHPWLLVAAAGAAVILAGIMLQIAQLAVSIRRREELRDLTGDPWDGRSLEWATPSPPPAFNFAVLPHVEGEGGLLGHEAARTQQPDSARSRDYAAIEMPRNSPTGFICAFFATFMGFALIWHIWWMVAWPLLGAFATFVVFAWRDRTEYMIPAETVARIDRANRSARSEALARCRRHERVQSAAGQAIQPPRTTDARHACARGTWPPSASSSATASGSSCSATSSCSPPSSRPTRCWSGETAGGPSGRELFHLRNVGIETACLLLSSFTCGLASIGAGRAAICVLWRMAVTFVLGAAFLARDPRVRRHGRAGRGSDAQRVPLGLLHAGRLPRPACDAGLLWLLTMMAQVFAKGYRADILRRILCFSLFWHTLDIIWVALFTVVYLMGAGQ